jgi:hypothetical protein
MHAFLSVKRTLWKQIDQEKRSFILPNARNQHYIQCHNLVPFSPFFPLKKLLAEDFLNLFRKEIFLKIFSFFFCYFCTKKLKKIFFIKKNLIYKNISAFSVIQKNFPLSGKIFSLLIMTLIIFVFCLYEN